MPATYQLELTPGEMKVTHSALRCLLSDLSHDDHEVLRVVRGVLAKLPPADELAEIRIGATRRQRTPTA